MREGPSLQLPLPVTQAHRLMEAIVARVNKIMALGAYIALMQVCTKTVSS